MLIDFSLRDPYVVLRLRLGSGQRKYVVIFFSLSSFARGMVASLILHSTEMLLKRVLLIGRLYRCYMFNK